MNTNFKVKSSLKEIEKLKKTIEQYGKNIPQTVIKIVDRLTEEALDNNYKNVQREKAVKQGNVIIGKVKSVNPVDTFKEFGTGITGSRNPHLNEILQQVGWKYDVNNHGEAGWWYPTTESDPNPIKSKGKDGTIYGWTRGVKAQKKFYTALQRVQTKLPEVAMEEFKKINKE